MRPRLPAFVVTTLLLTPGLAVTACTSDGDGAPAETDAGTAGGSDSAATGDATDATDATGATATSGPTDPSATATEGPDTGASTSTAGEETTDEESTTGAAAEPLPTNAADLIAWLEAGEYLGWTAESAVHGSAGPHFGDVRTYVNAPLLQSLEAANATHPVDAAAVKELYGMTGAVQGWSVIVKVADGAGGDTWYFLEYFDGTTYGDGVGDGSCTGCHGAGSLDYFKSPFPLQ